MSRIAIAGWTTPGESAITARAFGQVFSRASNAENVTVHYDDVTNGDALLQADAGTIRIVSLLPYAADLARPWAEIEPAIRALVEALAESGDPVLIVTVLRCVAGRDDDEGQARLVRIRRLNLLAVGLSHDYGAFVLDLDRILADIGGLALGCDYRLESEAAVETASDELALSVVANCLDDVLPFEAQERMKAAIEAGRSGIKPVAVLLQSDLVTLGRGRQRQRVSITTDAVQENHAGWLVGQVLSGRIGPGEAARRLVMAIRRRGLRDSTRLLVAAMRQVLGSRRPAT
ncbi:MAG: hypothetical protein KGM49_01210 [Sphingomonadales bacterium]|nr:hypothetical protein [Sphingomonadales bacterium]